VTGASKKPEGRSGQEGSAAAVGLAAERQLAEPVTATVAAAIP